MLKLMCAILATAGISFVAFLVFAFWAAWTPGYNTPQFYSAIISLISAVVLVIVGGCLSDLTEKNKK